MKSISIFIYFHSRKCIWSCRQEIGGHFVPASMWYTHPYWFVTPPHRCTVRRTQTRLIRWIIDRIYRACFTNTLQTALLYERNCVYLRLNYTKHITNFVPVPREMLWVHVKNLWWSHRKHHRYTHSLVQLGFDREILGVRSRWFAARLHAGSQCLNTTMLHNHDHVS